jgi:tetratricopeptide (TPR) repeat protein
MNGRRKTPEELLRTGLALHQEGKIAGAAKCYEDILRVDRNSFPANYFLALTCGQRGQHRKAAELLGRAIALNPNMPEAHYNRGNALLELEQVEEAERCFARAVALKPGYAAAWHSRSTALEDLKRFDEALASCDMAVALTPYHALAHSKRGDVLEALDRFDEALVSLDRAVALEPDLGEAWAKRGVVLENLGRLADALASCDRAAKFTPEDAANWANRGNSLKSLARFDEALASYDKSIALAPDLGDAYFNRSILRLLTGDIEEGLRDYEWRKRMTRPIADRKVGKPLWLGAPDLAGKTILVHDEQGFGDTIQFCRYLDLLRERGGRVLFAPKLELMGLLHPLAPDITLVDIADRSLTFDVHCPLMSLPLALGTTAPTIPHRVPYLRAEPERIDRWAGRIGKGQLTIGICWQGSTTRVDRGRSFPLSQFYDISKLSGVHLISLHKGAGEAQLAARPDGMTVETLGPDFDADGGAFLDTAAVMSCCDLIITSDTAIAHLAGALALPVWVVLQHVPDWRWMLDRPDSPWYPTMRLFRQAEPGDWRGVFSEIEHELKQIIGSTGS